MTRNEAKKFKSPSKDLLFSFFKSEDGLSEFESAQILQRNAVKFVLMASSGRTLLEIHDELLIADLQYTSDD